MRIQKTLLPRIFLKSILERQIEMKQLREVSQAERILFVQEGPDTWSSYVEIQYQGVGLMYVLVQFRHVFY